MIIVLNDMMTKVYLVCDHIDSILRIGLHSHPDESYWHRIMFRAFAGDPRASDPDWIVDTVLASHVFKEKYKDFVEHLVGNEYYEQSPGYREGVTITAFRQSVERTRRTRVYTLQMRLGTGRHSWTPQR